MSNLSMVVKISKLQLYDQTAGNDACWQIPHMLLTLDNRMKPLSPQSAPKFILTL